MIVTRFPTTMTIVLLPVCMAALFTSACPARADLVFQGQVLDYQSRQLYHSQQTPGYTAWNGLWKLPDGNIQCDFVEATGPANNPTFTFPVLQSSDHGRNWTRPTSGTPTGYSRGMAVFPDGKTMVRPAMDGLHFGSTGHLNYANNDFLGVQYSTDGGQTWSPSVNLVSPDEYQMCLPLNIKPLRDGRVVAMAGLVEKGATPVSPNVKKAMFVGQLSAQGLTWGDPIPLMTLAEGICEESDFVELPDGDLFFMHRLQNYDAAGNYLSQSRKQSQVLKNGDSFIPQTPTVPSFGASGQGFPCELLTREGILLDLGLFGSHWSDNLGQTWHDLLLDGQPLTTYYYPQAVQADDGTIVVTGHYRWDDVYGEIDESIYLQTFRLSPVALPEPSAMMLLSIAAFSLLLHFWRRRTHGR